MISTEVQMMALNTCVHLIGDWTVFIFLTLEFSAFLYSEIPHAALCLSFIYVIQFLC